MKKIYWLLWAAFMLTGIAFSGCKKQEISQDSAKIRYGTFFGMCAGYCNQSMEASKEKIVLTQRKNGLSAEQKVCTKTITPEQWSGLTGTIDWKTFSGLNASYGCPDCADGGGEWVEIENDGKTHKVLFEYSKAPKELETLVAKLRELHLSFKDCN